MGSCLSNKAVAPENPEQLPSPYPKESDPELVSIHERETIVASKPQSGPSRIRTMHARQLKESKGSGSGSDSDSDQDKSPKPAKRPPPRPMWKVSPQPSPKGSPDNSPRKVIAVVPMASNQDSDSDSDSDSDGEEKKKKMKKKKPTNSSQDSNASTGDKRPSAFRAFLGAFRKSESASGSSDSSAKSDSSDASSSDEGDSVKPLPAVPLKPKRLSIEVDRVSSEMKSDGNLSSSSSLTSNAGLPLHSRSLTSNLGVTMISHHDPLELGRSQSQSVYDPNRPDQPIEHSESSSSQINRLDRSLSVNADGRQAAPTTRFRRAFTVDTHRVQTGVDDDSGLRRINQYLVMRRIGRGMYGKVKLVFNTEDQVHYAMKIMSKSILKRRRVIGRNKVTDSWENVKREIAIMKKLDHPNVVRLSEVIDDDENDKLFLVMDYVEHGSVMKGTVENEPLGEEKARHYFRELIAGLEYLHFQHIIHRDIKPENLLLSQDDHIKIADFGVSSFFIGDDDRVNNTAGSAAFMAPEMCGGAGDFSGRLADVWSTGVSLYVFIYGKCPFMAENVPKVYQKIVEDPLVFPKSINPKLQDLLSRMLDKNPAQRIKLADIKLHDWVTNDGLEPMAALSSERINPSEKEVSNAWIILVKLKNKLHRRSVLMRERRRGSSVASGDGSSTPSLTDSRNSSSNFLAVPRAGDMEAAPMTPEPFEYPSEPKSADESVRRRRLHSLV